MTQTHKLVPIEPTALQVRAGQLGVTTTCAKAIYAAMLASAPEVGEAVDMDENTAKRFRGILSLLGISAPESDESLILCQFPLLGMMRHKIQHIYYKPDRTTQLEADKARLVEALRKAQPACVIASDFKYDDGDEDAAQEWNMINVSVSALIAEMEAKK